MDKYADLTAEALASLSVEKRSAFDVLIALDAPTIEQVDEAAALAVELDEIKAEVTTRETAASEAAERFTALRSKFSEVEVEAEAEVEEAEVEAEVEAEPEAEVEVPAEPEKVSARSKGVVRLAAKTARPAAPKREVSRVSITAAADVSGFATGSSLPDVEAIGKAVVARMKGFTPPTGDGRTENIQKFGVASINRPFTSDLTIDRGSDDMEVLAFAAKESRLEGESLVAAGGWCAPSETMYDLCAPETTEGLLSVAEVNVKRGGINYTTGPDFADFFGDANGLFVQTEAQAIAGTTKPCVTVDCPAFTEVRLDAVGLCIKIPILTNSAYPELVQRYVSGFMTAYQHRVSANVLARMIALTPAARVLTGLGSSVDDTLEGLSLIADQERQKRRLSMTQSLEVLLPFWVKNMFKADLRRRTGQVAPVTDGQLDAHFTAAHLSVQYLYNWQDLATADVADPDGAGPLTAIDAEVYPASFQALMYPAGTFVKGTTDVINLSAVYDAASLAENVYTGLFMEEGILVAKMCGDSNLVTIPTCNAGRRGAEDITCV